MKTSFSSTAFCTAILAAMILVAKPAKAVTFSLFDGSAQVTPYVDLIMGAYNDKALDNSAGRETQVGKLSRALVGVEIRHKSGFGAVIENNFCVDEPRHKDGNKAYNDYYKNLGTDLLYYGDMDLRNAYLEYRHENGPKFFVRAGRMVNLIGFDENDVPYWGRLDSPHARYLDKDLGTGAAAGYGNQWFDIVAGYFGGQGRPDRDYNYYLNGQTDPNTSGNSSPALEIQAKLTFKDYGFLFAGYHHGKTGSAPGSIFSGKHNDNRLVGGMRAELPIPVRIIDHVLVLGQYGHYEIGLTEDGQQGSATTGISRNLDKDGWFATVGVHMFNRVGIYVTREEIDRIDSKVWADVAGFNPNHAAFDSKEESTIFQIDWRVCRWATLSAFYRLMHADYTSITSGIAEGNDLDKAGLVLRARL
jgi:hypothetical protein